MILQQNGHEVKSSGLTNQQDFSIKASSKAFRILSDGLYSNKIRAVIRELSCNAYDAHVAADKKDVQFDVSLPNDLTPFFSVKDYGVGLSKEHVMKLYTTFFESTKGDSNDFVGALGLGSKSPFSYVDSFTVKSWFNGELNAFICFIGDNGTPQITHLNSTPTDQCNGVEVSMPVAPKDFDRFKNEAKYVFTFFTVKPNIKGSNLTIDGFSNVTKYTENVSLCDTVSTMSNNAYIIQGNVSYPIVFESLDDNVSHSLTQSLIGNKCLIMNVEIGEVDFAASREEISYIPETIKTISNYLKEFEKLFVVENQKLLDTFTTKSEALFHFNYSVGFSAGIINDMKLTFKGQPFIVTTPVLNISKCAAGYRNFNELKIKEHRYSNNSFDTYSISQVKAHSYSTSIRMEMGVQVIMIVDTNSLCNKRMNYYLSKLTPFEGTRFTRGVSICTDDLQVIDYLKEALGTDNTVYVSDINLPPSMKVRKNKDKKEKGVVEVYEMHNFTSSSTCNVKKHVPLEDGGVYVNLYRNRVIDAKLEIIKYSNYADLMSIFGTCIYGVSSKAQQDKLKKDDKWVSLEDKIADMQLDPEILRVSENTFTESVISGQRWFKQSLEQLQTEISTNLFTEYMLEYNRLEGLCDECRTTTQLKPNILETYRVLAKIKGCNAIVDCDTLYDEKQKVLDDHPILRLIPMDSYSGISEDKIEIIKNYVRG